MINEGIILDCTEYPAGSAIIWKMQYISIVDWYKIPLKNIAVAIKEGVNMQKFANDYNINLIERKKK